MALLLLTADKCNLFLGFFNNGQMKYASMKNPLSLSIDTSVSNYLHLTIAKTSETGGPRRQIESVKPHHTGVTGKIWNCRVPEDSDTVLTRHFVLNNNWCGWLQEHQSAIACLLFPSATESEVGGDLEQSDRLGRSGNWIPEGTLDVAVLSGLAGSAVH